MVIGAQELKIDDVFNFEIITLTLSVSFNLFKASLNLSEAA